MIPALVIFDVDKTLNRSKQPISQEMAATLSELLSRTKVAVMSGGLLSALQEIVVKQLPSGANLNNLYISPTSGGALYELHDGDWNKIYSEEITSTEADRIINILRDACTETGLIDLDSTSYGERIEYRGSQVTLSALGQLAPVDEKEAWDPDGSKKTILRDYVATRLPEYDVKTGGSTSIDVTKNGVNKAYGVRKISEHLGLPISDMLYVGDALYANGNDEVVKETGIKTHQVSGAEETLTLISSLL